MRKHLKIAVLVAVSVGVIVACKSSGTDKAESTTPVAAKAPTEAPAPAKPAAEARPKPNPLPQRLLRRAAHALRDVPGRVRDGRAADDG